MSDGKKECPYCGKKYKGWEKHIKSQHPTKPWPPITFGNNQPCDVCGEKPTRVAYSDDNSEIKYLCEAHSDDSEASKKE
ncbi:hypothetical protein AKJ45_03820 [candidate division MSBL1 archaeon SCGC-AAA261F19]|uniref:Uncharacterized protein n=1 Tax=candidate division MSBL1 archaeon SCGC-AAA261F19 TaxID=1698275 RepID=A0A133V687_9EURY|nr:hypothetical protein AKJ45_03820 [candidate division MSBL1 archaeon SCGC-AAA261F19]